MLVARLCSAGKLQMRRGLVYRNKTKSEEYAKPKIHLQYVHTSPRSTILAECAAIHASQIGGILAHTTAQ
jgi:hypothetical protein